MKKSFSLVSILFILIGTLSVYVLLLYYGISCAEIRGESMAPTYHNGDLVMLHSYLLQIRPPQKNEIIAFRDKDKVLVVKRVILVPGEVDTITTLKPRILGPNEYVVIGDNLNESYDSRYYGAINRKQILGIVK